MVAVEVKKGGSQESASAQVLTSEHDDVAYQMWWELQQLRIHQSERSGKCESHLYREQRWCKSYISHTFAAGKSRCDARCVTAHHPGFSQEKRCGKGDLFRTFPLWKAIGTGTAKVLK